MYKYSNKTLSTRSQAGGTLGGFKPEGRTVPGVRARKGRAPDRFLLKPMVKHCSPERPYPQTNSKGLLGFPLALQKETTEFVFFFKGIFVRHSASAELNLDSTDAWMSSLNSSEKSFGKGMIRPWCAGWTLMVGTSWSSHALVRQPEWSLRGAYVIYPRVSKSKTLAA